MNIPTSARAFTRTATIAGSLLVFAACGDDNPVGPPEPTDVTTCSTAVTTGDTFVEMCELTESVRHVRIENLRAPATHASAQIVLGATTAPTASSGAVPAGQFRVLFYGGGAPAPAPLVQASFGAVDAAFDANAAFINGGATVCFDIHNGGATSAPSFILWIDGQKGANCSAPATLTVNSAYAARSNWNGANGAISNITSAYFRQSAAGGTEPKVTLSATPVLTAEAIAASTECVTTWQSNSDWQQLCTPAVGTPKHVRLENVQASANNSYFYAVFGQDASPTGNPAAGEGKMIFTGGRSNSGASWTWLRFGTGSTTQFNFTNASGALYTESASTVCFDLASGASGNAALVFWASGANSANCDDRSTLTSSRALYTTAGDEATGSIWSAPFARDKFNFIKTNNTNVSIGRVVISSESAAY